MFRTSVKDNGTVTVWNVFHQCWRILPAHRIPDAILASLASKERGALLRLGYAMKARADAEEIRKLARSARGTISHL